MYYCSNHIPQSWDLTWMATGNFTGVSHAPHRAPHTSSKVSKPHNGVFAFGDDPDRYQAFQQSFAAPDFVHSGQGGRISAFNVFPAPIGPIEVHGVPICTTCTGMAVLINRPDVTHGFPYRHDRLPVRVHRVRRKPKPLGSQLIVRAVADHREHHLLFLRQRI